MAKIKGEVKVTPEDEASLNELFLPEINAERAENDEEPLANMDAYADWLLAEAVPDWAQGARDKKSRDVGDLYDEADDETQKAIDDLLEP